MDLHSHGVKSASSQNLICQLPKSTEPWALNKSSLWLLDPIHLAKVMGGICKIHTTACQR